MDILSRCDNGVSVDPHWHKENECKIFLIVADRLHRGKFLKVWSFQVKQVNSVTLEITVSTSYKYICVCSATLTVFVYAVLSQLQDVICGFMAIDLH